MQKENLENEVVQCNSETNALTFDDTKQNQEHVRLALAESKHDSFSNDKNCNWFEQINAEENGLESNTRQKKAVKDTDLLTMTTIMEFMAL